MKSTSQSIVILTKRGTVSELTLLNAPPALAEADDSREANARCLS